MDTGNETNKRRIIEHLTMAQLSVKAAYGTLMSAGAFAAGDREQEIQMRMLQFNTWSMLAQIENALAKYSEEK